MQFCDEIKKKGQVLTMQDMLEAYSNWQNAEIFSLFHHPEGAANFCACLLKPLGISAASPGAVFTNIHQKFD